MSNSIIIIMVDVWYLAFIITHKYPTFWLFYYMGMIGDLGGPVGEFKVESIMVITWAFKQ